MSCYSIRNGWVVVICTMMSGFSTKAMQPKSLKELCTIKIAAQSSQDIQQMVLQNSGVIQDIKQEIKERHDLVQGYAIMNSVQNKAPDSQVKKEVQHSLDAGGDPTDLIIKLIHTHCSCSKEANIYAQTITFLINQGALLVV
jgi:hypothetical protein